MHNYAIISRVAWYQASVSSLYDGPSVIAICLSVCRSVCLSVRKM